MTDLSEKTILVAEDDPINMLIAVKILERKKAHIVKAFNGLDALRMLASNKETDLVLLDLEMPEMDGYITVRKIREQYLRLPVIAFTAYFLDREMETSLKNKGFTDSISKPFNPDIFYEKIFRVLEMKN